jgi:hypothetical protein
MRQFTLVRCAILAAIFAAALWLRLHRLNAGSLTFDETWHLELSTGRGTHHELLPVGQVLREERVTGFAAAPAAPLAVWGSLEHVTHPPLFLVVLRFWRLVLGEGDFIARLLPAVTSALAVLVLLDVARLLAGFRAGLWSAAIMAIAPAQISVAQEVRGYPQLLLLSLLTANAAVRMTQRTPTWRRSAGLAVGLVAMMLTHYFAIGVCAAIGLYLLVQRRDVRNRAMIAIAVAAAVYAACWGPFLVRQLPSFTRAGDVWLIDASPGATVRTLQRLAVAPARLLFEPLERSYPLVYASGIVLVLLPLMLRTRKELLLWVLWLAGSVGFLFALDLARSTTHLDYVRYFIVAGPPLYFFLARVVPSQGQGLGRADLVPGVVVLACAASLPSAYEVFRPPWRDAARELDSLAQPGETIIFLKAGQEVADKVPDYFWSVNYLCLSHNSRTFPREIIVVPARPDDATLARIRRASSPTAIVVTNVPNVEELLPGSALMETRFFPYAASLARIRWRDAPATGSSRESSPTSAPSR